MAIHSSLAALAALLAFCTIIMASDVKGSSLSGAYLRGLTAPQQAALAGHLAASTGGAAEQLPRGRHLLQGKGKAPAGKLPAPAPAPELDIIIDLPPGVEPRDLTPAQEEELIGTALGIAAAIDTIDGLVAPAPAPAKDGQAA